MIELQGITKTFADKFNQVKALKKIDLKINVGEFISIVGPSGSGKSTLLYILGLLETASYGQYFLKDKNITNLNKENLAKTRNKTFGFVFQNFQLIPKFNIKENVLLPMRYSKNEFKGDIYQYLTSFGISDKMMSYPNQLSGGQQQRVAIARALINDPDIILADEPTGNLDSKTSLEIINLFLELHKRKKTIIMVTHNQQLTKYSDRTISLSDGEIC